MMKSLRKSVCGLVLLVGSAVVAVLLIVMVGIRTECTPVLTVIRSVSRARWNPRAMRNAGTPGAYASVLQHVGRVSGRRYETPIAAIATDGGFVIASPYGRQADWLKNVLASGSATILDEGGSYPVERPELVPSESVAAHFATWNQLAHRWLAIDECLVVHHVAEVT